MAIPVITQPATPRTLAQGMAIPTLVLAATESPTSWAVDALPSGLSLNTSTGQITGTPITAGLSSSAITATNGSGTSDPVTIVWNIQAQPVGAGEWSDLEIDFDLVTRRLNIPGLDPPAEGEPLFRIFRGDKINLLIGGRKFGVLRDLKPGSETVSVKAALKEFEPEILLTSAGGEPEKVGSGDTTRFRIPLRLAPGAWGALADYEADKKTSFNAVFELELAVGEPVELYDESDSVSPIELYGGLGGAGPYAPEAIEETLVFEGLEATAGASYTLDVSLIVTGRPGQNVALNFTLTITWSGSAWVVSDLEGADTIQGPAEGGQWRVTLTVTDVAGDADSVDVDVEITTTTDSSSTNYVFEVSANGGGIGYSGDLTGEDGISFTSIPILSLWDEAEAEIGEGADLDLSYESPALFFAAIEAAWEDLTGTSEVVSIAVVDESTFRVTVSSGSEVRGVGFESSGAPDPTTAPTTSPGEGTHRNATLTGQLVQIGEDADQPLRYTAQELVEVPRDLIPDA